MLDGRLDWNPAPALAERVATGFSRAHKVAVRVRSRVFLPFTATDGPRRRPGTPQIKGRHRDGRGGGGDQMARHGDDVSCFCGELAECRDGHGRLTSMWRSQLAQWAEHPPIASEAGPPMAG